MIAVLSSGATIGLGALAAVLVAVAALLCVGRQLAADDRQAQDEGRWT